MKDKYVIATGAAVAMGLVAVLASRQQKPDKAKPIKNFRKKKYMGKWYEIARLPYGFERNLIHVTAEYALNPNGTVKVVNCGFNVKKGKREKVTGVAKFAGAENVGQLKVSFCGPFYSGYNILAVDPEYQYALVAGKNEDYLWLLSRRPEMPRHIIDHFLEIAEEAGFKTDKLIWTSHD